MIKMTKRILWFDLLLIYGRSVTCLSIIINSKIRRCVQFTRQQIKKILRLRTKPPRGGLDPGLYHYLQSLSLCLCRNNYIWIFLPLLLFIQRHSCGLVSIVCIVYTYRYSHDLCTPIIMAFWTGPGHGNRWPVVIIMRIETISPTSFFFLRCSFAPSTYLPRSVNIIVMQENKNSLVYVYYEKKLYTNTITIWPLH